VKIFEIFKDEGGDEKKLSNLERAELIRARMYALKARRQNIKDSIAVQLRPLVKAKKVFVRDSPEFNNVEHALNVHSGVGIPYDQPIDGIVGPVYMKKVSENEPIIKWFHSQAAKLNKIGFEWAKRKGEGGQLSELQRRLKALARARHRKEKIKFT
jgi:hypothetical protein